MKHLTRNYFTVFLFVLFVLNTTINYLNKTQLLVSVISILFFIVAVKIYSAINHSDDFFPVNFDKDIELAQEKILILGEEVAPESNEDKLQERYLQQVIPRKKNLRIFSVPIFIGISSYIYFRLGAGFPSLIFICISSLILISSYVGHFLLPVQLLATFSLVGVFQDYKIKELAPWMFGFYFVILIFLMIHTHFLEHYKLQEIYKTENKSQMKVTFSFQELLKVFSICFFIAYFIVINFLNKDIGKNKDDKEEKLKNTPKVIEKINTKLGERSFKKQKTSNVNNFDSLKQSEKMKLVKSFSMDQKLDLLKQLEKSNINIDQTQIQKLLTKIGKNEQEMNDILNSLEKTSLNSGNVSKIGERLKNLEKKSRRTSDSLHQSLDEIIEENLEHLSQNEIQKIFKEGTALPSDIAPSNSHGPHFKNNEQSPEGIQASSSLKDLEEKINSWDSKVNEVSEQVLYKQIDLKSKEPSKRNLHNLTKNFNPQDKNIGKEAKGEAPPLIPELKLDKYLKNIKFLIIIVIILALIHFFTKSQKEIDIEDLKDMDDLSPENYVKDFNNAIRKRLSPKEEVVLHYNIVKKALGKRHFSPKEVPPPFLTISRVNLNSKIEKPLVCVTNIFCDVFYGEKSISTTELKKFRKDVKSVLSYYS